MYLCKNHNGTDKKLEKPTNIKEREDNPSKRLYTMDYIMTDTSTIQLDGSVIKELKRLKRSQREIYTELIKSLIETAKKPNLKTSTMNFCIKSNRKK
ncbi:MAG: hypothetical protein M1284_01155 [Candidatus Parvarchaeota archaeon]|nr:hypothetical protein [Candidatus Parvarchaeota archaeon]MCL5420342.1 hypothetical protein [Candidatus Parvarchaeota archaeon]